MAVYFSLSWGIDKRQILFLEGSVKSKSYSSSDEFVLGSMFLDLMEF